MTDFVMRDPLRAAAIAGAVVGILLGLLGAPFGVVPVR